MSGSQNELPPGAMVFAFIETPHKAAKKKWGGRWVNVADEQRKQEENQKRAEAREKANRTI